MIKPSLAIVLLTAACGGGGAKPDTTTTTANAGGEEPAPGPLAPGTTGFPGLDWADTMAEVQADYPAATADGDLLELSADHAGEPATISFRFFRDSLSSIDVAYAETFPSMTACADIYHEVRAELARSLGETGDDNLGSFWDTDTASINLTCNPDGEDGEPASMSMHYDVRADL